MKNKTYQMVRRDGRKVRMHRHVMEQHLGRTLLPEEHVHHKNGDTWDNRLKNLQVIDRKSHGHLHSPLRLTEIPCVICGTVFRPPNHRRKCCSVECGHKLVNHTNSKLTNAQIQEMKALRKTGLTLKCLGKKFGVCAATACLLTRDLS